MCFSSAAMLSFIFEVSLPAVVASSWSAVLSADIYQLMLSSMCSICRCTIALVEFRSRLLTELNPLPSTATTACENRFS